MMVATDQQSSSTSSANTQTLESGMVMDDSSQNHTPTAVIVPIVIVAVALLIPIWLCLRRLRAPERVIPLYRQEESVEKPKLCEVALMGGGHGAPVTHSQPGWRRLRVSPLPRNPSWS
ncbi:hypothetical protein L226DRAFT_531864 [Lentinus tigrinus ALCF2SS1-7]|uniref:uncharacterized protein n=1 Tax=Lentinus tigrinus ALCF2SS1-7 TaxID=1328758 RepID=UPI001165FC1D|nr:hypothetical protein L226DRAFT_531864 [Lentinus tigrinus ALCF2SS1-7]